MQPLCTEKATGRLYLTTPLEPRLDLREDRLALMAVSYDLPGGQVLPVEALQAKVTATVNALCLCEREREVGAALPCLIRGLYTCIGDWPGQA